MHYQTFEGLLTRSADLAVAVADFLMLKPYECSAKIISSRTLCEVSFEHAESVRILISTGNFTSSLGVLRMQYESLVKAVWALFAASDTSLKKLQSELNNENAKWADKVPLLSEILSELDGKAPPQAVGPLREFKEYSWKPLSSYIHGGIHAISRRSKGYPKPLLEQAVRSSNGLLLMAGMNLVILSGDSSQSGKVAAIQKQFADCCPTLRTDSAPARETR
jgi:hypothetical protein